MFLKKKKIAKYSLKRRVQDTENFILQSVNSVPKGNLKFSAALCFGHCFIHLLNQDFFLVLWELKMYLFPQTSIFIISSDSKPFYINKGNITIYSLWINIYIFFGEFWSEMFLLLNSSLCRDATSIYSMLLGCCSESHLKKGWQSS